MNFEKNLEIKSRTGNIYIVYYDLAVELYDKHCTNVHTYRIINIFIKVSYSFKIFL